MFSDKVEPLIWADPRLSKPTSLVFDSAKENIYITQRFGIVKYNLNTSELVVVAGSNASDHTNRPERYETMDGSLFDARFGGMYTAYRSLALSTVYMILLECLLYQYLSNSSHRLGRQGGKNVLMLN